MLEAKDTVMDENQLRLEERRKLPDRVSFNNIAQAQAEISFKAGYQQALKDHEWSARPALPSLS